MPKLSQTAPKSIVTVCRENAAAVAESLGQCFDLPCRVEVGDLHRNDVPEIAAILEAPGLLVAFDVGGVGVACVVPATLPLPAWYSHPGDSEQARLQTLALEWSLNLLPPEYEAQRFSACAVEDLQARLEQSGAAAETSVLEVLVTRTNQSPGTEPARLFLIWPLPNPAPLFETAKSARTATPAGTSNSPAAPAAASALSPEARRKRLVNLPVSIVVCLAEKRIEMGQLLSLSPGALITFNKSCEDLLDLYVNNHRYCRGEAVKIGEKFGLKVNEVGTTPVRERRVING